LRGYPGIQIDKGENMNNKISMRLSCVLLLGSALASGSSMMAQVGKMPIKPAQNPESMTAFWEKFRAAVIKGDKETVAALSRFPISMGYGMSSLKNKAQLMKYYRKIFFNETNAAKCFPKAKPLIQKQRPKEFTIGCSFVGGGEDEPFQYTFTLIRNGWRFTGFENINE
jgi:hypothetical protein